MSIVSLEIANRTGCLYEGDIKKVTCPTTSGYITVLPNHVSLVSVLAPGTITVVDNSDTTTTYEIESGIVEIRPKHIAIMIHKHN
jgi:F-type H+-transporting ATPase subunit epsilon